MTTLENAKSVYFLGICGTLMASFAVALKDKGLRVVGSDTGIYPPMSDYLRNAGVTILEGYKEENIKNNPCDVYIIGNVIRKVNPEAQYVLNNNLPYYSLPSGLHDMKLKYSKNFVVAGTHGKTTTSAILSFLMQKNNLNPSYFIGGATLDFERSFVIQNSDYFVLEGDEYDTAFFDKVPKFTHYNAHTAILTSVEFDHADIYKDLDDVKKAFNMLTNKIPANGRLIVNADETNTLEAAKICKGKIITYGENVKSDYQIKNWDEVNQTFEIIENINQKRKWKVKTPLAGLYNACNFTSAFIACIEEGLNPENVISCFLNFKGVKRRQEVRAKINNITIIDDFAHHPTAVDKTLTGLKAKFFSNNEKGRLISIFEPRSATSRRSVFQHDYAKAFKVADIALIAKPYDQTGIDENNRFSTEELIKELKLNGTNGEILFSDKNERLKQLIKIIEPNDVVAILSNGGFDGLIQDLIGALKSKYE